MTVAAVYARFSSDAQRDESIEIQVRLCSELIEREGWTAGEVYADYAMTGRNGERPAFRRMREDMAAGAFDVLVVYKQDRLARNVELAAGFKRELFARGMRLVSYREGEVRDDPEGQLMGTMQDAFAEYYSRNLSVLIRGGIEQNARNCRANGQRRYGYRTGPDGRYEVDGEEAAVVRRIFSAYLAGKGTTAIAAELNADGIRTERGNPWSKQTISKMLKADRYIGVYRYAGHVVEGGMPAIIDEGDYQMVQDKMALRKSNGNRASVYMLSGKLHCAVCGAPMTGTSGRGKSGTRYDYYRCTGGCGRPAVRADKLERLAADTIRKVLSDDSSIVHMTSSLVAWLGSRPDRVPALEADRDAHQKRLDALVGAIADGVDPKSVKGPIAAEQAAVDALDAEIAETRRRQLRLPTVEFIEEFVRDMVRVGADDPEGSRILVDTYVDRIYCDETGDHIALCFAFDGPGEWDDVDLDEVRGIVYEKTPENRSSTGVCVGQRWWSCVDLARTPGFALTGAHHLD